METDLSDIPEHPSKPFQFLSTELKGFLLSVLATFLGVLLAFYLSSWSELRKNKALEHNILKELRSEIQVDLSDLKLNLDGHYKGLDAAEKFIGYISFNNPIDDSISIFFQLLLRDFLSIQHTSAYESLKTKGLDLISSEAVRLSVVDLYDFYFEVTEKIEETYTPHEFFSAYFHPMTGILSRYIRFTSDTSFLLYHPFSEMTIAEKNLFNFWLQKLLVDRHFLIQTYLSVIGKTDKVLKLIDQEIMNR